MISSLFSFLLPSTRGMRGGWGELGRGGISALGLSEKSDGSSVAVQEISSHHIFLFVFLRVTNLGKTGGGSAGRLFFWGQLCSCG